ncbi:collagen-like protein [Crocosphaera sp. XPORK-15E]|uniref:collagen-like protein n=1 Tax=Crocosphaera sp. XPORK-15E TaxID=3110247 RepID=UPI002B21BF41|nr:collagen-like protein [Crocosphaera sp. XPORK-15E]MEA5537269.1 collagen-like protein [Crocosphaera sp. XPORK-15E]
MHLLSKIVLSTLLFTSSIVIPFPSSSEICAGAAWGAEIKTFGQNGTNAQNGPSGQAGDNSENLTIFADGSPLTLNLVGENGQPGENGKSGENAQCDNQPVGVKYNLQAPSGGMGGNGGNGGDGGNAGSLTIYATNLSELRQIYVNAAGGKGGQPGQGGDGGDGCNCTEPYWTLETCSGNPGDADYRCTTLEFRCQDGRKGSKGATGVLGREGLPGKLTLINLDKPLEPDKPAATVTMGNLKDKGYLLSKNIWETRNGASGLFAPGSVIEDQYLALVQRLERSFLLIWNAPQPFNKFTEQQVTLKYENDQGITVDPPQDLWIEATTQQRNNITQFIVYNAIPRADATRLESQKLSGKGTDMTLTLIDKADQSNLIATKFKLDYSITRSDPRFRTVSDYSTKYEGEIPEDLVILDGNKFTINVGKLPIDPNYLRSGLGVEIKLIATRTFAGYTAEQTITVTDVIGPFR